ncbi:symporter small accessory protein [Candidatus Caldatribacterium sp. SIUC1]|uniref:symporter small accessory protein n=1 Tax=Candidatus Caldatribacterium sp. SIUC1 TaxID=3418365 RepID=UPI003F691E83
MLGLHDFWITLAYLLCIGSTLLCVVYGLVNWNRGGEGVKPEKILHWEKEEEALEE